MQFDSQIHERGYRNRPLTEEQKQSNRTKPTTCVKVEQVFGCWVMQMGGKLLRSIIEQVHQLQADLHRSNALLEAIQATAIDGIANR